MLQEGDWMRKIFKMILAIFAVVIIIIVAFGAIILLDIAAYTATGSQTLTPTGTSVGKALVIYDPGLSGTAKGVADKVAVDLQTRSYTVTEAGVKSPAASNTANYRIIVVGGPVYAGALTSSIKEDLNSITVTQGTKVGVFGSGQGATTPEDIAQIKQSMPTLTDLSNAIVVKIGSSEDLDTRAQDFVNQLTS
jgi:menaquinone-dependent protoporphyrinogen IX oxidase